MQVIIDRTAGLSGQDVTQVLCEVEVEMRPCAVPPRGQFCRMYGIAEAYELTLTRLLDVNNYCAPMQQYIYYDSMLHFHTLPYNGCDCAVMLTF